MPSTFFVRSLALPRKVLITRSEAFTVKKTRLKGALVPGSRSQHSRSSVRIRRAPTIAGFYRAPRLAIPRAYTPAYVFARCILKRAAGVIP